jgi:hypothetical protein
MPRRSPHVQSLFDGLFNATIGQMFDRLRNRSSKDNDARVRSLSTKLLQQGVTPIELQLEMIEMREAADMLYKIFSKKGS